MIEVKVDMDLDGLLRRVSPALDRGARAMADVVAEEADRTVPVDEGDLKRSGETVQKMGSHEAAVRYGGKDAPHALAVHEFTGERGASGRPWLRDALTGKAREAVKAAAKTVRKELAK